jgi:hypothetical protein
MHKKIYYQKKDNKREGERGFALMIIVFFFLAFFTSIVLGFSLANSKGITDAHEYAQSRQTFYTSESGIEDALYRMNNSNIASKGTEVLSLSDTIATTTLSVV